MSNAGSAFAELLTRHALPDGYTGSLNQYDSAGRLSADTATSLGSSGIVDGSIRRIGTSYDDMGRVQYVTSYSNAAGTTAVNQVKYEYNGWRQVYREYEEHDGAVDANTLFVQYDYADGATGGVAKYVRLDEVTYPSGSPNGREVHYNYGATGAIDDIMSRLSSIYDDANDDGDIDAGEDVYAGYKYLGGGTIVEEDYAESQTKLSYLNAAGTNITGMDRFGRVTDQVWTDYGANPDTVIDEYTYTYDRVGNRTSKGNTLHTAFNETYTYDALDRLTSTDRGDGTSNDQTWGLDGLGNFATFNDGGTSQTRTVDAANEITGISGSSKTPAYDAAGNMKFGPKPGNETTGMHYAYDAWNRLVAVYQDDGDGVYEPGTGDALVASYKYDGTNRRIEKVVAGGVDTHYYYNKDWQLIEERQSPIANPQSLTSYVWSPRYVDSPIVRFHDGNGDGDYLDAGDNIRYFTTDANHNVTAAVNASDASVANRYVYDAYGKATAYDAAWTTGLTPTSDGFLYCGYQYDAETRLYLARNRYYTPTLSVFTTRDPMGFAAADANLYRYVHNRAVVSTDAFGLADTWWSPESGFRADPGATWIDYKFEGVKDLLKKLTTQFQQVEKDLSYLKMTVEEVNRVFNKVSNAVLKLNNLLSPVKEEVSISGK
jgi:RHS repeat-associated protein